jgi:hypothetical protein
VSPDLPKGVPRSPDEADEETSDLTCPVTGLILTTLILLAGLGLTGMNMKGIKF